MRFHPLIKNYGRYFSRLKQVCHTQTLTSTDQHISSLHSHLWVHLSAGRAFPQPEKNGKFLQFFIIREYGSTLFVVLAHAVPSTNTKFKPLLLPSQVGMPYKNTLKHSTAYFKSTLTFLGPAKRWKSISAARQKSEILVISSSSISSESSTLYVGLACIAPPNNTNFWLTFLLTQIEKALYEDFPV